MRTKQDEKLEEVRAILQRLQRIGADGEEEAAPGPATPMNGARPAVKAAEPPRPMPPPSRVPAMSSEMRIAAIALPVFFALGGTGLWFWSLSGEDAPPTATSETAGTPSAAPHAAQPERSTAAIAPKPDAPAATTAAPDRPVTQSKITDPDAEWLAVAQAFMDRGKVASARRILHNGLAERKAEAALLLARAYDPNSLQLIPNADAGPDPAEAERWYRRWSQHAARQGLELDQERLERIINAMSRP